MTTTQFIVASAFGNAFAEHFGLPKHATLQRIVIDVQPDTLLGAQVTIALGADDLAAIAALMQPQADPAEKLRQFQSGDYRPANARRAHGAADPKETP